MIRVESNFWEIIAMDTKAITYGAIGFILGVILVLLIGRLGMSGMMGFGRGRMMDGWFGGRNNDCHNFESPRPQNAL
jgi:hypothetical protein